MQPLMALCGLLALAFFLVSVHVVGAESPLHRLQQSASNDVRYSELYVLVSNVLKIALVLMFQLMLDVPSVLTPFLVGGGALLLTWTITYRPLFGVSPCCQPTVTSILVAGHAMATWAALCCWLQVLDVFAADATRLLGLRPAEALCALGWAAIALVALGAAALRRLGAAQAHRRVLRSVEGARTALLRVERAFVERRLVCEAWGGQRRTWRRLVQRPTDLIVLLQAAIALEQHIRPSVQSAVFSEQRTAWQHAVSRCESAAHLLELITALEQAHAHALPSVGPAASSARTAAIAAERALMPLPDVLLPLGMDVFDPAQTITHGALYHALVSLVHIGAATPSPLSSSAQPPAKSPQRLPAPSKHSLGDAEQNAVASGGVSSTVGSLTLHSMQAISDVEVGEGIEVDPVARSASTETPTATEHDVFVIVPATAMTDPSQMGDIPIVQAQLVSLSVTLGAEPILAAPLERISLELSELIKRLQGEPTDNQRWDRFVAALHRNGPGQHALSPGDLTCAAAALVAKTFTFSFRQKEALIKLYPRLAPAERAGFALMLDQVLPFSFDRMDVQRSVATIGVGD